MRAMSQIGANGGKISPSDLRHVANAAKLQQAAAHFAQVNYQTRLVQQRYIYLVENSLFLL